MTDLRYHRKRCRVSPTLHQTPTTSPASLTDWISMWLWFLYQTHTKHGLTSQAKRRRFPRAYFVRFSLTRHSLRWDKHTFGQVRSQCFLNGYQFPLSRFPVCRLQTDGTSRRDEATTRSGQDKWLKGSSSQTEIIKIIQTISYKSTTRVLGTLRDVRYYSFETSDPFHQSSSEIKA